jgi:DNA repair photolyase
MMKKRCGVVKTYPAWIEPKIVSNALELLDKELPKLRNKIQCVFLCFSTDPFMYKQPEVNKLTLKVLQRLNQDNIRATVITKGVYPTDLSDTTKYNKENEYGSTIVTLSEDFRRKFEPGSAPVKDRISALKKLHEAGLRTWVSMEPYPTANVVKQDIKEVLAEISFVDKIVFGRWNYNKAISDQLGCKEFYNSMANYVIGFCEKNSIDFHIKEGTIDKGKISKEKIDSDALRNYIDNSIDIPSSSTLFNV